MRIIKFDPLLFNDANRALEEAVYDVRENILSLLDTFSGNAFIAYSLGRPVGIICSDMTGTKSRASFSLYVAPKYRRKGIGSALFEAVCKQAAEKGVDGILCDFAFDEAAVGFISSLGFNKIYSSHYMSLNTYASKDTLGFERYNDGMFFDFVNAEAKAFYPIRSRLGIKPAMILPTENMRSFLSKAADSYFVLRKNGQIVAGGGVYLGEISDIFVDESMRNCGIGKKLIERCVSQAYKNRIETVFLWVISDNRPAVGLYRSLGFETLKTHDFYIKYLNS